MQPQPIQLQFPFMNETKYLVDLDEQEFTWALMYENLREYHDAPIVSIVKFARGFDINYPPETTEELNKLIYFFTATNIKETIKLHFWKEAFNEWEQ